MKIKRYLLIAAAVLALGVGAVVITGAGAQQSDAPGQSLLSRVAAKLGIGEDKLTAAVKDARLDQINEKLAAGDITQEQADQLKQRVESGKFGLGDFDHDAKGRHCLAARFVIGATAQVLHMDKQQVLVQLQQGKSLAEIAQAQGMSVDAFKSALSNEVHSELQAKVDAGKITQEQADKMFQRFTSNLDAIVNHHPEPGEAAHCRHHGPSGDHEGDEATPEASPQA